MTNREFYEAIANGTINEEIIACANAALEKMDATNEKRRETAVIKRAEKEAAKAPVRDAIVAVMTKEPKTATTLIEEAGVEIKPQAIPSLLKGLVETGVVGKDKIKIGKGNRVGYFLV